MIFIAVFLLKSLLKPGLIVPTIHQIKLTKARFQQKGWFFFENYEFYE